MKNILFISMFVILFPYVAYPISHSEKSKEDSSTPVRPQSSSKDTILTSKIVETTSSPRKKWDWKKYGMASSAGVIRGLASFPFKHTLDCIRTNQQDDPTLRSGTKTALLIYQKRGILGFYTGAIPNSMRMAAKQSYRYPLMFYFPSMYRDLLPLEYEKEKPILKKALTGLSIALVEVYMFCPLERLTVFLMTLKTQNKHPFTDCVKDNRGHLTSEFFKGHNLFFPKQVVSWTTFLAADYKAKALVHQWTGIPRTEELPFISLMSVGTAVAMINTAATLPFDTVSHLESKSLIQAFKTLYQKHGAIGFYSGWPTRLLYCTLNSMFTVTIIEKLEKRSNK